MACVPEVIISPSDMVLPPTKHFAQWGKAKTLRRQNAHEEDICPVNYEELDDDLDSGIGSTTSSFSRTFSDASSTTSSFCRTFSDCHVDDTAYPNNSHPVKDIADGLKDVCPIDSGFKSSLQAAQQGKREIFRSSSETSFSNSYNRGKDIADCFNYGCTIDIRRKSSLQTAKQQRFRASSGASFPESHHPVKDIANYLKDGCTIESRPKSSLQAEKQQRYRASSGYGTGESNDLSDSLGSSAASSVFYDLETVPPWQADCDRLIRELMTERCIENLDRIDSFSDGDQTRHIWFWQPDEYQPDVISSDELMISDSIEGSEGFVSYPEETECHEYHERLCLKMSKGNASQLHSASMCHSLTGENTVMIQCPLKQADCGEARGLLKWLKKCYLLGHLQDCCLCERTLSTIIEHNIHCLEFYCSLPFCNAMKERHQSLLRQPSIEEMKAEVSSVGKLSAMESMLSSLKSLSSVFWNDCQPGAAEAIPLAFLGRFGKFNVLLARMKKAENASAKSSTIVIKKVSRRESLLPALKRAKSITNSKLVSFLDVHAVEGQSHFILISEFTSGVTFKDLLFQVDKNGEWEWRSHFCQVISALSFLHEYNILFLNWEVDNILVKSDGKQACLLISQGSLTLLPDVKGSNNPPSIPVDDTLQEMLSPYISAPEILQKKTIGFPADVWGCGVLMYQLIKKEVPYGFLRHSSWSEARETILAKERTPHVPDECPDSFRDVLHRCFSWSPEGRPPVKDLLKKSSKPFYVMASDLFEEDYLANAANGMDCLD